MTADLLLPVPLRQVVPTLPVMAPGSLRRAPEALDRSLPALGLVLVGAGLSVAMDASSRRAAGAPPRGWLARGTVGLVLVGSGLSVFGDAVRRRAQAG